MGPLASEQFVGLEFRGYGSVLPHGLIPYGPGAHGSDRNGGGYPMIGPGIGAGMRGRVVDHPVRICGGGMGGRC